MDAMTITKSIPLYICVSVVKSPMNKGHSFVPDISSSRTYGPIDLEITTHQDLVMMVFRDGIVLGFRQTNEWRVMDWSYCKIVVTIYKRKEKSKNNATKNQ